MRAFSSMPVAERLADSIKAKARAKGERPDRAMVRYVQERIAFRLAETFPGLVVKGSFAEVARNPAGARFAPDLDLWLPERPEDMDLLLTDVFSLTYYDDRGAIEDGIDVTEVRWQETHAHLEEPGMKFRLTVTVGKVRVPLKVDFAFGLGHADGYETAVLPSMVPSFGEIWLSVQPAARAIAEKLHAMAEFGAANTRVKDVWDLHAHLVRDGVNVEAVAGEIAKVFAARGRDVDPGLACLTREWAEANEAAWTRWHAEAGLPLERSLTDAVDAIRPPARAALLAAARRLDAVPEAVPLPAPAA